MNLGEGSRKQGFPLDLGVVRKEVGQVYDCVGILPRGLEERSRTKAVPGKGTAVPHISQNRGVFGHFCGLEKMHSFVFVQT